MSQKKICSHPTCLMNSEDNTIYIESDSFPVCGKHVDFDNEVSVIVNDAASELSEKLLRSCKTQND